jgi:hypothetical protein
MEKKLLLKKSIWLILFILVQLYFMVFNWKLFTLNQEISTGFGTISIPPYMVLSLLALAIIGALTWISYIQGLKKIIYELESGLEQSSMKDKQVMKRFRELVTNEENVHLLKEKLGIAEIRNRQEELVQLMADLSSDLGSRDQPPSS